MEELFVTYEIAVKLKQKGFNKSCLKYYNSYQNSNKINLYNEKDDWAISHTPAPVYQQVIDWLRINHKIEVSSPTQKEKDLGIFYGGYIKKYESDFGKSYGSNFRDYYEAYNHAIEEALKII